MTINDIHELSEEIKELQNNYHRALNCVAVLRKEKATLLVVLKNNNPDQIKLAQEMFILDDFDKQKDYLNNWKLSEEEIKHYSTEWE